MHICRLKAYAMVRVCLPLGQEINACKIRPKQYLFFHHQGEI